MAVSIPIAQVRDDGPPRRKKQATAGSEAPSVACFGPTTTVTASGSNSSHLRGANLAILQTVDDEALVRTAIKKMAVAEVPELLEELQRGLYRSGDHLDKYLRVLSLLLEEKFTFLSMTNLTQYQALKQLLAARTSLLEGCLRLKGRLDLLLSHTTKPELKNTRPAAKQTYESDSEEEEDSDEEDEEEDDDLKMNGGDDNEELDLDGDLDEEMFGSEEEEDGDEGEEDTEGAAVEADDESADEGDNDEDDDDDDALEEDDDDDDDDD